MLEIEYISELVLDRKLSSNDQMRIHSAIRASDYYSGLVKLDDIRKYECILKEDLKELINLYVSYTNPELFELYGIMPELCCRTISFSIGIINLGNCKPQNYYTEDFGSDPFSPTKFDNITVNIVNYVSFRDSEEKPLLISSYCSNTKLGNWISSNIDKDPRIRKIVSRIRAMQYSIVRLRYRMNNDKIRDLYLAGSGYYNSDGAIQLPNHFEDKFKNRKNFQTYRDVFEFDEDLFIFLCNIHRVSYLKRHEVKKPNKEIDNLESDIKKLKKLLDQ